MGPAVRDKVRQRPLNFFHRPAIWQDEMVEVRETFRRIARVKQSGFTVWDRREIRSSGSLRRNRLAKIKNQVPAASMHNLPGSAARMIQNNRSQPPFVSLNHMKNVVSMCRRIQSQNSLTERKKNPYDPALYPVFIRRPADAGQTASQLRPQKRINTRSGLDDGEVPYAYTPPKFTFLFDVSNGAVPSPGVANRPSSEGTLSLGTLCSSRPSSSGMYKVWVQERPSSGSFPPLDGSKRLLSRLPAFKKLSGDSSAISSSPSAMKKASTNRTYHRIVQDYWPFTPVIKSSLERSLRSTEDMRRSPAFYLERPPSRCTRRASSFSPSIHAEAGEAAQGSYCTQQQQHGNISNRSRSTVSDCVSVPSILDSRSSYVPGRTSSAGSLTLSDEQTDSLEDHEENSRYLSCMPTTCGLFKSSTELFSPRFTATQSTRPPSRKGKRKGRLPARILHLTAKEASSSSSLVLQPASIQNGSNQERPGESSPNDAFKAKGINRPLSATAQKTQLSSESSKAVVGNQRPFSAPSHGRLPKRPHLPSEELPSPARHKLVTFATSPGREESEDQALDLKFTRREEGKEGEIVDGTDTENEDMEATTNAQQLEQKQMGSRTQQGHGLDGHQCQELPGQRPRSNVVQEGCFSSASSCEESGSEDEGHVILKHSADPYVDFKNSMMNMILRENLQKNENELEELFQYYVDLNPAVHHQILYRVIEDVRQELKSPTRRGDKTTNPSSCSTSSSS
eukprot:c19107_g2_i1 orf=250-2460(+)